MGVVPRLSSRVRSGGSPAATVVGGTGSGVIAGGPARLRTALDIQGSYALLAMQMKGTCDYGAQFFVTAAAFSWPPARAVSRLATDAYAERLSFVLTMPCS